MTRYNYIHQEAFKILIEEFEKAKSNHPENFASVHEGYAVLLEEVDELWAECKVKEPDLSKCRKEAIQIAAMAIRFIQELT